MIGLRLLGGCCVVAAGVLAVEPVAAQRPVSAQTKVLRIVPQADLVNLDPGSAGSL